MRWVCLFVYFFFHVSCVFAEQVVDAPDLLSEEWENEWTEEWPPEPAPESILIEREDLKSLLDYVSVKIKADAAYSDNLTLARAKARFLFDGAPLKSTYLKADLQLNYFNHKDDLLLDQPDDEFVFKINELWVQHSVNSCNLKLGRLGVFWGSVEGTGAIDVVTPFDLTEPLLTDFSLIRRSQDVMQASCFENNYSFQLFFIPKPLLDQYTVHQTSELERLEESLDEEWGGRITKHAEGFDVSLYYGRFYSNAPKPVIDPNTFNPTGVYVDQFELLGAGLVYAVERLLFELEMSFQKELMFQAQDGGNNNFLSEKRLKDRLEVAIGAEYTTSSNHNISSGIWFYEYEHSPLDSRYSDTYVVNMSWSKQLMNDDLSLSALALWQKEPERHQATVMAEYLITDFWSTAAAMTYQDASSDGSGGLSGENRGGDWAIQMSTSYQF